MTLVSALKRVELSIFILLLDLSQEQVKILPDSYNLPLRNYIFLIFTYLSIILLRCWQDIFSIN